MEPKPDAKAKKKKMLEESAEAIKCILAAKKRESNLLPVEVDDSSRSNREFVANRQRFFSQAMNNSSKLDQLSVRSLSPDFPALESSKNIPCHTESMLTDNKSVRESSKRRSLLGANDRSRIETPNNLSVDTKRDNSYLGVKDHDLSDKDRTPRNASYNAGETSARRESLLSEGMKRRSVFDMFNVSRRSSKNGELANLTNTQIKLIDDKIVVDKSARRNSSSSPRSQGKMRNKLLDKISRIAARKESYDTTKEAPAAIFSIALVGLSILISLLN